MAGENISSTWEATKMFLDLIQGRKFAAHFDEKQEHNATI